MRSPCPFEGFFCPYSHSRTNISSPPLSPHHPQHLGYTQRRHHRTPLLLRILPQHPSRFCPFSPCLQPRSSVHPRELQPRWQIRSRIAQAADTRRASTPCSRLCTRAQSHPRRCQTSSVDTSRPRFHRHRSHHLLQHRFVRSLHQTHL